MSIMRVNNLSADDVLDPAAYVEPQYGDEALDAGAFPLDAGTDEQALSPDDALMYENDPDSLLSNEESLLSQDDGGDLDRYMDAESMNAVDAMTQYDDLDAEVNQILAQRGGFNQQDGSTQGGYDAEGNYVGGGTSQQNAYTQYADDGTPIFDPSQQNTGGGYYSTPSSGGGGGGGYDYNGNFVGNQGQYDANGNPVGNTQQGGYDASGRYVGAQGPYDAYGNYVGASTTQTQAPIACGSGYVAVQRSDGKWVCMDEAVVYPDGSPTTSDGTVETPPVACDVGYSPVKRTDGIWTCVKDAATPQTDPGKKIGGGSSGSGVFFDPLKGGKTTPPAGGGNGGCPAGHTLVSTALGPFCLIDSKVAEGISSGVAKVISGCPSGSKLYSVAGGVVRCLLDGKVPAGATLYTGGAVPPPTPPTPPTPPPPPPEPCPDGQARTPAGACPPAVKFPNLVGRNFEPEGISPTAECPEGYESLYGANPPQTCMRKKGAVGQCGSGQMWSYGLNKCVAKLGGDSGGAGSQRISSAIVTTQDPSRGAMPRVTLRQTRTFMQPLAAARKAVTVSPAAARQVTKQVLQRVAVAPQQQMARMPAAAMRTPAAPMRTQVAFRPLGAMKAVTKNTIRR